ncbi:asparaginase domain-containing protein, partial [Escherichia coli]|uniref:asparaginase domain-containing protein n=1 Tax=Escherichia coli TaxID=562 RepID=UPI0028DEE877
MEESAYFLSLCYPENENRPVIVTGSQRSGDELGSDALSNLQHAVWAVCSEKIRNSGVTVLFNQALFMPKYVHKSHTHFLQAFTAQYY